MVSFQIVMEENPNPADIRAIREGLRVFNQQFVPGDDYRPVTILLRGVDQTVVGGLLGATNWGWLHVDILWLDEPARNQGLGSQLLAAAEKEALQRGCRHIHLDTMDFQALVFYKKCGYTIWGELEDMPAGHRCYFLQKSLIPGE